MIGSLIGSIGRLARFDTCAIAFLSLSVPLFYVTGDLLDSIVNSLPVLTISMCGFVINDLHDIDKDIINHPDRPLPSKRLSLFAASLIYFSLLTISLTLVKAYVAPRYVYLYLLFLISLINYNYVVQYVPSIKNLYVAAAGILPILILASLLPPERSYARIIVALFFFLFAREMLMDIEDSEGDEATLAKRIGLAKSRYIAFAAKAMGTIIILPRANTRWGLAIFLAIIAADVISFLLWKHQGARAKILFCMKLQLLLGLYFLF